jgi:hypothetical protein
MVTASAQQGVRTTPVIGWEIEQPEYEARVARVRRELERRRQGYSITRGDERSVFGVTGPPSADAAEYSPLLELWPKGRF